MGIAVIVGGLALAGIRFVGASPAEDGLEGAMGSLALGAVVAAPGLLAILAIRSRPALLLPAGIVLIPLSFLSFAGITLPLLIPASMLLIGYGRRSSTQRLGAVKTLAAVTAVLLFLIAAVVVLFIHPDPRSYTTPLEDGTTSDVITIAESVGSLMLTACAIASGWLITSPRSPRAIGDQFRCC